MTIDIGRLAASILLVGLLPRCGGDETETGNHTPSGNSGSSVGGHGTTSTTSTGASSSSTSGGAGGGPECASAGECDDGDACTVDTCAAGSCDHASISADDGDACTVDSCDPASGPVNVPVATDDGDPCTIDACDPVAGVSHTAVGVDDGDACTVDSCDASMGVHHVPLDPDDGDACTVDACDPVTGPSHTPVVTDDGNACTVDACDPVTGPSHTPINVDDGNACTADACNPATGVTHTLVSCDDSNPCTADSCAPATGCAHQPLVYFSETFADNSKGWSLGMNWQIGPEKASPAVPPAPLSNPDPTTDHTSTADNGVAGVIIGGNLTNLAPYGPFYLTSPGIDMSTVSGPVTLEFWRYLNSDYPPFMNSTVEVFNGTTWIQLYSVPPNGASPQPRDAAWTNVQYDVTAAAAGNTSFRIRWGIQVFSSVARQCSSWNVDDVRLLPGAPGVCP